MDPARSQFYDRLLAALREPALREGEWRLAECIPAWEGNPTADCFIAHAWQSCEGKRYLAVINYAPNQIQCYVHLPFSGIAGSPWQLRDLLGTAVYDREGDELQGHGLYLDMPAWQAHLFSIGRRPSAENEFPD